MSKEKYESKPLNAASLQTRKAFSEEDLTVQEFAEKVGCGHAWRAGTYGAEGGDSVKAEHVNEVPAIALDFDKVPHSPYEIAEYAKGEIGCGPNVAYATYSQDRDTWKRRKSPRLIESLSDGGDGGCGVPCGTSFSFRLVWVMESPLDPESYRAIQGVLVGDVFSRFCPDKSTKDPSRLWYGGSLGADVLSKKPVPLKTLNPLAGRCWTGAAVATVETTRLPSVPREGRRTAYVRDNWQEVLKAHCPLFRRFASGDYLCYNERLLLLVNLGCLRYRSHNGRSILNDLLPTTEYPAYQGHTYGERQLRDMLRARNVEPFPCVETPDGGWVTVAEFFESYTGEHFSTPNIAKCSLEELDEWMEGVPDLLADDRTLYIKSQTASGKTRQIARFLAGSATDPRGKVVYAAPTYENLREMEERVKGAREELGAFAEVLVSPRDEYTDADMRLMRVGLPKRSQSEERAAFLKQLYDEDIGGVFLITHALLANLGPVPCSRIIIDENPEGSLVRTSEIEIADLLRLGRRLGGDSGAALDAFASEADGSPDGAVLDTGRLGRVARELRGLLEGTGEPPGELLADVPGSFFDLLTRECRKVRDGAVAVLLKSPLIDNAVAAGTPVKVLTATPRPALMGAFYGGVFTEVEAPMAANRGRVVQFLGRSGAKGRGGCNVPDLADYIREVLPGGAAEGSYVISFKGTEAEWERRGFRVFRTGAGAVHLANNTGLDCLKGSDLIVAGKYDLPDSAYRTLAHFIDGCDAGKLARQNVTRELFGIRRRMYLIEEPTMREIQLEYILCMAQQAAGRARALREETTVYLFCDVPIPEADEYRY